jgi:hypothetical protein
VGRTQGLSSAPNKQKVIFLFKQKICPFHPPLKKGDTGGFFAPSFAGLCTLGTTRLRLLKPNQNLTRLSSHVITFPV